MFSILLIDKCVVAEMRSADEANQSWAAWAWSYVPQLTASNSDLSESSEFDSQQSLKKVEQSVLDIGVYIMHASVVFKVCMW